MEKLYNGPIKGIFTAVTIINATPPPFELIANSISDLRVNIHIGKVACKTDIHGDKLYYFEESEYTKDGGWTEIVPRACSKTCVGAS